MGLVLQLQNLACMLILKGKINHVSVHENLGCKILMQDNE